MQLFYADQLNPEAKEFLFSREESKHIYKVLRKKEGDILHITNGKGWLFTAIISFSTQNKCLVSIKKSEKQPKRNYHLHLAVAPTKMNDRYEWFLEKATEIGVDEITPILCDHSERKVIKPERFERILQSALKQSQQFYLPKLHPMIPFSEFLKQKKDNPWYMAHCEDGDKKFLKDVLIPRSNYTILIGPEGDFSETEIQQALSQNIVPISLGENRLRTETAAIVAAHGAAFVN